MSRLSPVCTFEGISLNGKPRPGSGALPITTTCWSSCAVAGLLGVGGVSVSAGRAVNGSVHTVMQIRQRRDGVERGIDVSPGHYRGPGGGGGGHRGGGAYR